MVLPASRQGLECPAIGAERTVALRVSSHPLALQLARSAGGAITSTSANRAGEDPPGTAEAIDPALASRLDLTLDGGPTGGSVASTILDLTEERPRITREGAVDADRLARALGFRPRGTG
jgi:L-threonylcarbamoyladenylate synthase